MRKFALLLFALYVALPVVCYAQRGKAAKKARRTVVAEAEENPLVAQMLEAVQRVVFIDSMVVAKNAYYNHIPLSEECGYIQQSAGLGQYTSELGDRRIEAVLQSRDSTTQLVMSDFIGGEWTTPAPVKGIGNANTNNPYVMPDGTTLYYAQKGEKTIGGYDIFVTRYNAENATFLRPENIGMPFASEANDYLYVVDEPMQLGYFVTDRRQPEGKVCIYVFIPSTSRKVYPSETYTKDRLRSLAAINRIADTWGDGKEKKKAMERLQQARRNFKERQKGGNTKGAKLSETGKMRQEAEKRRKALAEKRKDYATATAQAKDMMKDEILRDEKELENLLIQIKKAEKEERNKNYGKKQ